MQNSYWVVVSPEPRGWDSDELWGRDRRVYRTYTAAQAHAEELRKPRARGGRKPPAYDVEEYSGRFLLEVAPLRAHLLALEAEDPLCQAFADLLDEAKAHEARAGQLEARLKRQSLPSNHPADEQNHLKLSFTDGYGEADLVNLTPDDIVLCDDEGDPVTTIPSSGEAWCETERSLIASIKRPERKFPVHVTVFGAIKGLPEPAPNTIYIVTWPVLSALAGSRADVVAPDTTPLGVVRDSKKRIIGVKGFQIL